MLRFLSKLARTFQTANTTRTPRRAQRRARLGLEGLEDRMLLSAAGATATLKNGNLQVIAVPSQQITFQADQHNHNKLDVLDNGKLLRQFSIASIEVVNVTVAGLDTVTANYSNGNPFPRETQVILSGSGLQNTLTLEGSVKGDETYISQRSTVFGEAASIDLGGSATQTDNDGDYVFTSAIGTVKDLVTITEPFVVESFGSNVTLSASKGATQTLSSLSDGGAGDTLIYANKAVVKLEMLSDNATATLNATAAAAGEQTYVVDLIGGSETVQINATPKTVDTKVVVTAPTTDAGIQSVFLAANSGAVSINGNSETVVSLGQLVPNTGPVGPETTAGIKANVSVSNVATLLVVDDGDSRTEHVKVTDKAVSGSGLFGNNTVKLSYSGTGDLTIDTGENTATYTVVGSKPGATFNSSILINGSFGEVLNVAVTVDAESDLNLQLNNNNPNSAVGSLSITALGGTFNSFPPVNGAGTETVTFRNGLTSVVNYENFASVTASDLNS